MKQSAELKERVLASVRRTPSPVRSATRREVRRVLVVTLGALVALFFGLDGMRHAMGRPAWFLVASLSLWGAVALAALRAAWRAGIAFGAGALTSLGTVIVGAPAAALVGSLALVQVAPEVAALHPERSGLTCFALVLAAAVCPLAGLTRARRSSDPLHPVASGAALGVACGACGGAMVDLWCPVAAPSHVLVGHVLPMAALALVGAMLGARVIAMRARPRLSA